VFTAEYKAWPLVPAWLAHRGLASSDPTADLVSPRGRETSTTPAIASDIDVRSEAVCMTTAPAPSQLRLIIEVDDFADAVHFYRDVLGMPEQPAFATSGEDRVAILHAGAATIELATRQHIRTIDDIEGAPAASEVRPRLALEVENTEDAVRAATAHGMTLVAAPVHTPFRTVNARVSGPGGWHVTFFQELESLEERTRHEGFTTDDRRDR
jgi:methylmalonyl-CoA/ethylmalonyl-CoA epimerase